MKNVLIGSIIIILILIISGRDHIHKNKECAWVDRGDGRVIRECTSKKIVWYWEKEYQLYNG